MIILAKHVSGRADDFNDDLNDQLTKLQNIGTTIIDIKYSSSYMQSNDEWYVIHGAIIIYQKYEPTTATAPKTGNYNRHS